MIRQQKRFRFRHWDCELGGDICITDTINVNGRAHTVFLNGDAMGKSMQGAGGAIVMGTVFRAIIARARNNAPGEREAWLLDVFREINTVFESFEGSMLMSAVYGLLDNESGDLIFVNLEHPRPVLLRDGGATFIPEGDGVETAELISLKFGTPGAAERYRTHALRLRAGDKLVLGSDGRDDILLPDGNMNSDENVFAEIAADTAGDPAAMAVRLEELGVVRDDLSLLTLEYLGTTARVDA